MSKQLWPAVICLLLAASSVLAECTINGKPAPDEECNQIFSMLGPLFAGFGILWLAFFLTICGVIFVGLAFWVWMLYDWYKRDFPEKNKWLVILIVLNTVGAVAYYFMIKRKIR